jgi:hypothetical protein
MRSSGRAVLLTLTLSVCALAAPPQDALSQARAQIAVASFEKALAIAEKALKHVTDNAVRGDLELVRAECFHALRKKPQMKQAMERALRANPLAALDADSANPELMAELDHMRKALTGMLVVSGSFPADEAPRITLDEQALGVAPLTTAAVTGKHRVKIVWPDGQTETQDVVVHADLETAVPLTPPMAQVPAMTPPEAKPEPKAEPKPETKPEPVAAAAPAPAPEPQAKAEVTQPGSDVPRFLRWQWLAIAGGALGLIAGVSCLGAAGAQYSALMSGKPLGLNGITDVQAYASRGQTIQDVGIFFTVAGLVAAGAGIGGLLLFDSDSAHISVMFTPQGPMVSLRGALP